MPEEYKKNIEGWKRLNPDYDIRCWNEDNYDFTAVPYMKEAYRCGGNYLMYATDYARMDVLYMYGGTEQNPCRTPQSTKASVCPWPLVCRETEISQSSLSHKRAGLSS